MTDDVARIPTVADPNDASEELLTDIRQLVGDAQPTGTDERRSRDRFPIVFSLLLTPIDNDGNLLLQETAQIVGKDLSVRGFSFSHMGPLQHRRAIVSITPPNTAPITVSAEVMWTRQTSIGLYESGCRFIQKVVDKQ
jgi:hypothetical protein